MGTDKLMGILIFVMLVSMIIAVVSFTIGIVMLALGVECWPDIAGSCSGR